MKANDKWKNIFYSFNIECYMFSTFHNLIYNYVYTNHLKKENCAFVFVIIIRDTFYYTESKWCIKEIWDWILNASVTCFSNFHVIYEI